MTYECFAHHDKLLPATISNVPQRRCPALVVVVPSLHIVWASEPTNCRGNARPCTTSPADSGSTRV